MGCFFTKRRQMNEAKSVLGIEIRELFDAMDEDKNGHLALDEITAVLEKSHIKFDTKDVADLMNLYDEDGDQRIDFVEFQHVLRDQINGRAENLVSLFKIYDINNDNLINLEECLALFRDVGVPKEKLQVCVEEYFPHHNSTIGFKDFCKIFSNFV